VLSNANVHEMLNGNNNNNQNLNNNSNSHNGPNNHPNNNIQSDQHENHFLLNMPDGLSYYDMEVMKMTAQFTARNGHQFQLGLMSREQRNPQFDFLKQGHEHHQYYLNLVESYTRVLLPPKNVVEVLELEYGERQAVLNKLIIRAEKEKQERKKKGLCWTKNCRKKWPSFKSIGKILLSSKKFCWMTMKSPINNNNKMIKQLKKIWIWTWTWTWMLKKTNPK